jgi:putative PIG3 family NAD(P)H quinone oxidoreductase
MRAAVITEPGGPEMFRILDIEEPEPGPDELLVEVKATALNRADLAQRQGRYPAPPGLRQDVPGLEMAGVVAEVGRRVHSFKVGDRTFGLLGGGGYSERVVIHERMAMPIPENLSFLEAAAIPEVFFTAYDALFRQCGLAMGESVLIHAAGSGVGTAAIQLAHVAGARTFGTAGSEEKLAKARALGLDVGMNYREQDFAKVVAQETEGRGVDVILDVVGGPYWERNVVSLATKGRMVMVAVMGGNRLEASIGALMQKRARVFGTVLRARPLEEKIALAQEFQRHVLPLLRLGRVKAVIDSVYPLEQVGEAHARMEANKNFGKIILKVASD